MQMRFGQHIILKILRPQFVVSNGPLLRKPRIMWVAEVILETAGCRRVGSSYVKKFPTEPTRLFEGEVDATIQLDVVVRRGFAFCFATGSGLPYGFA